MKRLIACLWICTACMAGAISAHASSGEPSVESARGAYLAAAAGCVSCHTDQENDGVPFAGGHALESPYGTFYSPNITPDTETGIGNWTDAQFLAAVKEGTAPDGSHYYPAFPYPSYAGMTDMDALAIKAYLDSLQPVRQAAKDHDLAWYIPGRWAMSIWQALFSPWEYPPAAAGLERGAYLVRHLGHCGECHSPRNLFGQLQVQQELGGSPKDAAGRAAPAIDGAALAKAGWTESDVTFFLEIGMLPDGDFAGGGMTAVIDDNTAKLTPEDRSAIARFLLAN